MKGRDAPITVAKWRRIRVLFGQFRANNQTAESNKLSTEPANEPMKYCPKCNAQFDDINDYCLIDGAWLTRRDEAEIPTIVASRPVAFAPAQPRSEASQRWLFPLLGLLCGAVLILGYIAFSGGNRSNPGAELKDQPANSAKSELAAANPPPQSNSISAAVNSGAAAPETVAPAGPSAAPGNTRYGGTIGGSPATFNLTWANDRVRGNYYYNNSPGTIYAVSGNNPRTGHARASAHLAGKLVASMTLNKGLGEDLVCWSGDFIPTGGSPTTISFCRDR